jgi:hypothetical protein
MQGTWLYDYKKWNELSMRSILLEIIHVVYLNASVLQPKERIDRRTHKETDTVWSFYTYWPWWCLRCSPTTKSSWVKQKTRLLLHNTFRFRVKQKSSITCKQKTWHGVVATKGQWDDRSNNAGRQHTPSRLSESRDQNQNLTFFLQQNVLLILWLNQNIQLQFSEPNINTYRCDHTDLT